MRSAVQILHRLLALLEGKHLINDRPNLVLDIELDHLLEAVLRPVHDPLHRHRAPEAEHVDVRPVAGVVDLARDVADAVDQAAERDGVEGLADRLGAAVLEDHVGALAVRQLHDFVCPVRSAAVVDAVVGAESFRPF